MLRKKIIALASLALLSFGLSSPAQADPIVDFSFDVVTNTDPDPGFVQFDFSITFVSCADCVGNTLFLVDIYIPDGLVDIALLTLDAGWSLFESFVDATGTGLVFLFDSLSGGVLPLPNMDGNPISISLLVDVGDAAGNPGGLTAEGNFYFCSEFDTDGYCVSEPTVDIYSQAGELTGVSNCEDCVAVNVPEPGTLGLLGLGLLGLGATRRRRRLQVA